MNKTRTTVVSVFLLLLLAACGPASEKPAPTPAQTAADSKAAPAPKSVVTSETAVAKPQRGGTLAFAMNGDAAELDPHKTSVGLTRRWARLLYNTLVMTNNKGDIVPELAESWSHPDPNTVVFKLRKGVKFHDGTDFNAQAVKFNIERVLDPATKSLRRPTLQNIKSVEAVDDSTIRLNLKVPQASMLSTLTDVIAGGMISPASVKKWGDETVTHPVGTGPFEFVEWIKGDHMTVKRFDGYWRKDENGDQLPYLDQIIVKPIPDSSVRLSNLRTGNVDLMEVLPEQLLTVKADNNLKTVDWGSAYMSIRLGCDRPPFDNKALRQALAWGFDREIIHKAIYGSTGVVAQYELDPNSWGFDPNGKFYTRDVTKVKEKLAEGGKPNGFKFEARSYNTDLELRLAQAIKGQLAEVGIEMDVVPVEETQLAAERIAQKYEAMFSKGSGLPADPDDDLYKWFHSGQATGTKCYNPQVDEALDRAKQVYDMAERKALYAKVQALILDDSPYIFIHHDSIASAMNQKVMGFTPNIDVYNLQLDWIWLKK